MRFYSKSVHLYLKLCLQLSQWDSVNNLGFFVMNTCECVHVFVTFVFRYIVGNSSVLEAVISRVESVYYVFK